MTPLLQLVNNAAGIITSVGGILQDSLAIQIVRSTIRSIQHMRGFRFLTTIQSSFQDNCDATSDSSGTIVARIVPKDMIAYEHLKPASRRLQNVDVWRHRINPTNATKGTDTCSEHLSHTTDMVVMLDIDFKTIVHEKPVHVVEHMQRQAEEKALRTLQRMYVSTERKIDSFREVRRKQLLHMRGSSSTSTATHTNASSNDSVSSREGDEELGIDGYRKLPMANNLKSHELWSSLVNGPRSLIWMDVLPEMSAGIKLELDPCPPTVLLVQTFENFHADVFVGVPLVIETRVLHAERAVIVWFVGEKQVLYDSRCYTPTEEDVGKEVSFLINPVRSGLCSGYEEVYQYEKAVQKQPFMPIIEQRQSWLPRPKEDQTKLRVMSYNLLADVYATREIDQKVMYNHCKADFMARTRRMPLLVHEILAHQPDIICLQEVDSIIFEQLLRPVLKAHGYHGYYSNKVSAQMEGCAMFWSLQVFDKDADQEEFALRDLVESQPDDDQTDWDSLDQIKSLLDDCPELGCVVREKVGQILQVATLRLKNQNGKAKSLVVGNTHLFYHPMADHIRAIQTYHLCRQMNSICHRNSPGSKALPLVLCGDLNSDPLSGSLKLLLNRELEPDHFETWKNLYEYSWEKGEDEFLLEHGFIGSSVGDVPVNVLESFCDAHQEEIDEDSAENSPIPRMCLPSSFPHLMSGYKQMPEFTNYAIDFSATLDYILASKPSNDGNVGFEVVSSAPIPTKQEMKKYAGMPNENMPSDHVSIACDFKWKGFQK